MSRLSLKLVSFALLMLAPGVVMAADEQNGSAFDFEFTAIDGKPMPLSSFKGRVLLVVNTASFCGFTPQYKGLQSLYQRFEDRGLIVLGVPSNDFGGQEPKGEGEIKTFCEGAFGVTFPLTEKNHVKGAGAHPFYRWVVTALGPSAVPGWNFHKYLIGRDGRVLASFASSLAPEDKEILAAIEAELEKPGS